MVYQTELQPMTPAIFFYRLLPKIHRSKQDPNIQLAKATLKYAIKGSLDKLPIKIFCGFPKVAALPILEAIASPSRCGSGSQLPLRQIKITTGVKSKQIISLMATDDKPPLRTIITTNKTCFECTLDSTN